MPNLTLFDRSSAPAAATPCPSDVAYRLYSILVGLINRMDRRTAARTGLIPWGPPIPTFGDLIGSRVATVGLNPSNREFMDAQGQELRGACRRFHTLRSLGLTSWSDIDARHLSQILDACGAYFHTKPYSRWFRPLDYVLAGTHTSYYTASSSACHLDLIPYATATKWTALSLAQRAALLDLAGNSLAELLRDSRIRVILLNGHSVVDQFRVLTHAELEAKPMADWGLPRRAGSSVAGISYMARLNRLGGLSLNREVLVLGYNHNLQSSFGVTAHVVRAIRDWVGGVITEVTT